MGRDQRRRAEVVGEAEVRPSLRARAGIERPPEGRPAGAFETGVAALPHIVRLIATSYFVTDVRCPGVSVLGIALRVASPSA